LDELWVGAKDRILLCSDGLTRMVPDRDIEEVLSAYQTPQEAADRLVEMANERGGEDNTTVIVADLLPPVRGWRRFLRFIKGRDLTWPN
jgi:protein phosphatase